ncbi:43kDa postsynaptic protein [Parasponia andersonii]|uniref:RING-type E3 ubiquitin transferase n=1 Tax=Parasponia andersonii TaxID=3476 RepID=A0A2P5AT10_PARAD|nr:43kDa postsynaptic protein [Parasponia andersonii]
MDKYQASCMLQQPSNQNPLQSAAQAKEAKPHSNLNIMAPPQFYLSPELSSTLFYLLTGFFAILVIFVCIVALSVMLSLFIVSIVHGCYKFFQDRRQNDPEAGEILDGPSQDFHRTYGAQQGSYENYTPESDVQILEMLDRILRHLGEGREGSRRQRRALESMLPCLVYGSHKGAKPSSRSSSSGENNGNDECPICLEDFKKGDSCQVFPVCNHVFHSVCIGNWLRNNPTCPLCRNCVFGK